MTAANTTPALADFLVEWGFSLVRDVHGISHYERENVKVYVTRDTASVEIVVRNDDGWSEKRSLVLPGSQWPVHAAAEVVRAVLRERHS